MKMPDCPTPDQIQKLLDGETASSGFNNLSDHVSKCKQCLKVLNTFREIDAAAEVFAAKALAVKVPQPLVSNIMAKIIENRQTAPKKAESFQTMMLLRWVMFPALALVLLFSFLSFFSHKTAVKTPSGQTVSFNLAANSFKPLIAPELAKVIVNNGKDQRNLSFSELTKVEAGLTVSIPEKTTVLLSAGKNRFLLSEEAQFKIAANKIHLSKGALNADLKGPHPGFSLLTPDVSIVPLGTSFSVEIKSLFTKITLNSGKIELLNNKKQKRLMNRPGTLFVDKAGNFHREIPRNTDETADPAETFSPVAPPTRQNTNPNGQAPTNVLDSF